MTIRELAALDAQYYMHTFGHRAEVNFVSGSGTKLYDSDSREYIDFFTGIAVTSLGHGYPAFNEAVKAQLDKVIHLSNYFYNEPQALLAQRLVEASIADRVFFANSGGEANEGAAKLARKYFKMRNKNRYEVLSLDNSFHGRTLAMVAATGQPKYQKPYAPLPEGFRNVPAGDLDALEAAITPRTAAIMLETIQGEGGVIELPQDYLQGVEELCRLNGILLIVDEVQTGMGRTGKLFSYEHYGINPDIITCAKALGNGIPIGAILARGEAAEAFEPGDHGTTFGGGPLACAAGLAVMDALQRDGLLDRCAAMGPLFKAKLQALQAKHPCIVDVRGRGLMLGMELPGELPCKDVWAKLLDAGFVVGTANHNTLRFLPSFLISECEIEALCTALDKLLPEG